MRKQLVIYTLLFISILLLTACGKRRNRDRNSSRTRTEQTENIRSERTERSERERPRSERRGKSVVKMRKEYGVYHIPCQINGTEMEFIFDTGASDITMSLTEALFLYKQGKLTDDDFIGTQQYQIADGSIHEGAIVVLQTVKIGNRTLHNIQASIMENMDAPLLLGQSALSEFGKVSIDYKQNEIIFE